MLLSEFSLAFHYICNGMLHFIALLMTILVLIGRILTILDYIAIYAYETTLYSKYDQLSDLCQQLELASELESDL